MTLNAYNNKPRVTESDGAKASVSAIDSDSYLSVNNQGAYVWSRTKIEAFLREIIGRYVFIYRGV